MGHRLVVHVLALEAALVLQVLFVWMDGFLMCSSRFRYFGTNGSACVLVLLTVLLALVQWALKAHLQLLLLVISRTILEVLMLHSVLLQRCVRLILKRCSMRPSRSSSTFGSILAAVHRLLHLLLSSISLLAVDEAQALRAGCLFTLCIARDDWLQCVTLLMTLLTGTGCRSLTCWDLLRAQVVSTRSIHLHILRSTLILWTWWSMAWGLAPVGWTRQSWTWWSYTSILPLICSIVLIVFLRFFDDLLDVFSLWRRSSDTNCIRPLTWQNIRQLIELLTWFSWISLLLLLRRRQQCISLEISLIQQHINFGWHMLINRFARLTWLVVIWIIRIKCMHKYLIFTFILL